MNRKLVTAPGLIAIVAISALACGQSVKPSEPQLRARQGPPPHAPDEQLLPLSSVAPAEPYNHKAYPQKYSVVYMPVSLTSGRLRTPEFSIGKRSEWYDIMLQFEKPLPFRRMTCMTGATLGPLDERLCEENDPILRAEWTVWEEGRIVHWGSLPHTRAGKIADKEFWVQVGTFPLESGKKYAVQIHFTQDGSLLDVATPHLLVIAHQNMW